MRRQRKLVPFTPGTAKRRAEADLRHCATTQRRDVFELTLETRQSKVDSISAFCSGSNVFDEKIMPLPD